MTAIAIVLRTADSGTAAAVLEAPLSEEPARI